MDQAALAVGNSYKIKMVDHTYPNLVRDGNSFKESGGEETVKGKAMVVTVKAFPPDRPGFALVRNRDSGREHLVHVPSIETAALAV